jgi:ferritin
MRKLPESLYRNLLKQGHIELQSSILYLQASYWASHQKLPGTASFFRAEAQGEMSHAMLFFNYIEKRSNYVKIDGIGPINPQWDKPADLFKTYLDNEVENTKYINDLSTESQHVNDWNTITFLRAFLDSQLEDSSKADELYEKAKTYSQNPSLYYEFDRELGQAKPKPPTNLATN